MGLLAREMGVPRIGTLDTEKVFQEIRATVRAL